MFVPFARFLYVGLTALALFGARASHAYEGEMEPLERLEDVGDRGVAEDDSMEIGSASDKPKPAAPAGTTANKPPPPRKAAPPPPPPPPPADSIADAPPPRPEPAKEAAPARADASPEVQYDEFGEPKRKRRSDFTSPLNFGTDLQVSFPHFPDYIVEGTGKTSTQNATAVRLTFAWVALKNVGLVEVGAGFGFFGIFKDLTGGPSKPVDILGFPIEGFLTYRFSYLPHQAVVPYVSFGLQQNFVKQSSSNELATDFTSATGYYFTAGVAFSLRPFSRADANRMDYNYGINDTYVIVEYTKSTMLDTAESPRLNVSAFRAGLRFEY